MVSQPSDESSASLGDKTTVQKAAIRFNLCVVEDDPAQLRILMQRLKDCCPSQIQLFGTSSPQEAMQRIEARSVDILVTDLVMPYFSGVDLLRELKSRNTCTQALIMTATADVESLLTAFELGAVDYLLKPVVPEQVNKLVQEAVERLSRWRVALADAFRRTRRGLAVSKS
jgi:DNA-binding NtrC family response regulator